MRASHCYSTTPSKKSHGSKSTSTSAVRVTAGEVTGTCARLACTFTDITQRMLKYMVSTRDSLCWVVLVGSLRDFFDIVGQRILVGSRNELENRESLGFLIGRLPLLHSSQLASPRKHTRVTGREASLPKHLEWANGR